MSDEEHSFWEVIVTFPNGQRLMIDWNRAQHIEFSRSIELMLSLENGPHYFAAAL